MAIHPLRHTALQIYLEAARKYQDQGDLPQAIDQLTRAIESLRGQSPVYDLHLQRGLLFDAAGQLDRAIGDLDKVLQHKRTNRACRALAKCYLKRGLNFYENEQDEKAFADLSAAVALLQDEPARDRAGEHVLFFAYLHRGLILRWRGDDERALTEFHKARTINPSDYDLIRPGLNVACRSSRVTASGNFTPTLADRPIVRTR
jgi:tetratricopeptide (TPR) repeat protein